MPAYVSEADATVSATAAYLSYNYGEDPSNPDTMVPGYKLVNEIRDDTTGFYAKVYQRYGDANDYMVVTTGTEASPSDAYADAQLGIPQFQSPLGGGALIAWLNTHTMAEAKLRFVGHSLGGVLAEYFAYYFANGNQVITLATFNALSARAGLEKMYGSVDPAKEAGLAAASNYFIKNDPVSRIGNGHFGNNTLQIDKGNLSPLAAHSMSNFTDGNITRPVFWADVSSATPKPIEYLSIDVAQKAIGVMSSWGTSSHYSSTEASVRLFGGLMLALAKISEPEFYQLLNALLGPEMVAKLDNYPKMMALADALAPFGRGVAGIIGATMMAGLGVVEGWSQLISLSVSLTEAAYEKAVKFGAAMMAVHKFCYNYSASGQFSEDAAALIKTAYTESINATADALVWMAGKFQDGINNTVDLMHLGKDAAMRVFQDIILVANEALAASAQLGAAVHDKMHAAYVSTVNAGLAGMRYLSEKYQAGVVEIKEFTLSAMQEATLFYDSVVDTIKDYHALAVAGTVTGMEAVAAAHDAAVAATVAGIELVISSFNQTVQAASDWATAVINSGVDAFKSAVSALERGYAQATQMGSNLLDTVEAKFHEAVKAAIDGVAKLQSLAVDWTAQEIADVANWIDSLWHSSKKEERTSSGIDDDVNGGWEGSQSAVLRRDPLAIDLDGDGIETIAAGTVLFDHDGDGLKTGTGWLKGDDGWLVLDRSKNGKIDTGAELFGVDTLLSNGAYAPNGFAALADLDQNHDGKIDAGDAVFADLRIWKDANQDGVTDTGELKTLASVNMTAINLAYVATNITGPEGNIISATGSFTRTDNSTGALGASDSGSVANLNLVDTPFHSQFTEAITLSAEAKLLPNILGSGAVRQLREAATLSPTLAGLVSQFAAATTLAQRHALVEDILVAWSATSNFKTTIGGAYGPGSVTFDGIVTGSPEYQTKVKQLGILETFNGETFGTTATLTVGTIKQPGMAQSYATLAESVYHSLLGQTQLTQYYDAVKMVSANGKATLDFSQLDAMLETKRLANPVLAAADLAMMLINGIATDLPGWQGGQKLSLWLGTMTTAQLSSLATELQQTSLISMMSPTSDLLIGTSLGGGRGDDLIIGQGGASSLSGDDGNDALYGNVSSDYLLGGAGNDMLYGGGGADSLFGGPDRDWLEGGDGNDTLDGGDGNDSLDGGAGNDSLVGSTGDDLLVGLSGNDILYGGDGNDTLDSGDGNDFLSGETGNDLLTAAAGNDTLAGGDGNDTLDGGADSDTLSGDTGSDLLVGASGNDTLGGGAGDDTLTGGIGNDTLDSGAGNDIYQFSKGDGSDVIDSLDTTPGKFDTLLFSTGIAPSDVLLSRVAANNDVIVSIKGSTDKITIKNFMALDGTAGYQIEQIKFADGTAWSLDTIKIMLLTSTAGDDLLKGYATNDTISGGGGADNMFGYAGNDLMLGEDGNDVLWGGLGNDTQDGGAGNDDLWCDEGDDLLTGGVGNDTYHFGPGCGNDVIDNNDATAGRIDTLAMYSTLPQSAVAFSHAGDDLILTIIGTSDKLTVKNYFAQNGNSPSSLNKITFGSSGSTTDLDMAAVKHIILTGGDGPNNIIGFTSNDSMYGGIVDDVMYGMDGDDTMIGYGGNDTLDGGIGRDDLSADDGQDFLVGGPGGDLLDGGKGNDTYLFNRGDGSDTIYDSFASSYTAAQGNADTVRFGAGITPADVTLSANATSLRATLNAGGGEVVVQDYVYAGMDRRQISRFVFEDGTVWDMAAIKAKTLVGTDGNDSLYGFDGADTINGGVGADSLIGQAGGDLMNGGDGNDSLRGYAGNDTLDGGLGNDGLYGGFDNDTYLFGTGGGQDNVYDDGGSADAVKISGVLPSGLTLTRSISGTSLGLDLTIAVTGSTDQLMVQGQFSSGTLESLTFDNATVWSAADMEALAVATPTVAGTLNGSTGGNTIDLRKPVVNTVYGYTSANTDSGNDTYIFGAGGGKDIINDYGTAAGNLDTLKAVGLLPSQVALSRIVAGKITNDMVVTINGNTLDQVTVKDYFATGGARKIERITFDDSTVWGAALLDAAAVATPTVAGTVSGTAGADTFDLRNGIVTTAVGGTSATAESGNDTYIFGVGGGKDIITDYGTTVGNLDTVKLTGLLPSQVALTRIVAGKITNNLVITINGNTVDQLTVTNYFAAGGANKIEQVVFDDGTVWNAAVLDAAAVATPTVAGNVYGLIGADTYDLRNGVVNTVYGGTSASADSGDDTYIYGVGGGKDNIYDKSTNTTTPNADVLKLTGVLSSAVSLSRSASATAVTNDLIVKLNTSDQLTLKNYFVGIADKIEQVVFDDATVWDASVLGQAAVLPTGAALNGTTGSDVFDLRNVANTTVYGYTSAATNSGNDGYLFGRGAGADTISDYDTTVGNSDFLKFDANIANDQLWFRHVGNDLEVSVIGTTDKVTVKSWYSGGVNNHIELFKSGNGKNLTDANVENLVTAMAAVAPPTAGQTTLPQSYQDALGTVLAANWN